MIDPNGRKPSAAPTAAAAIIALAAVLTLPAALGPIRLNDSFWIDWVWLEQFARELGNGTLYPRWLPLSHNGLGSPVFYYYPPLAFYVGAPFALAGMSTYSALIATFFLGYVLSGATMYWWLKIRGDQPLLGALVFMLAPYHAFNFYERGAVAEFLATAFIPLITGGLWLLQKGRRSGLVIAALGYAALIVSHLPLALLTSIFLIGPLLLMDAFRAPRAAVRACLALAIGIAIAAIYWVPAIALEQYRDAAKLWENPVVQPSTWTFWNPNFRASPAYLAVLVMGAALAVPLIGLIVRHRSRWAMFGLGCVILATGLVPIIWMLPLLRSVQFPFRLLPVADFALATAMASVVWTRSSLAVALAPLLAITGFILAAPSAPQGVSIADVRDRHVDVPENLPPGDRPYSWPSKWALRVAATHRESQFDRETTTEPVFFFPAWQVVCAGKTVGTFPQPGTQLLSYRGRACARRLVMTVPEIVGSVVSLVGLLIMMALGARNASDLLRRRRPARGTNAEVTP